MAARCGREGDDVAEAVLSLMIEGDVAEPRTESHAHAAAVEHATLGREGRQAWRITHEADPAAAGRVRHSAGAERPPGRFRRASTSPCTQRASTGSEATPASPDLDAPAALLVALPPDQWAHLAACLTAGKSNPAAPGAPPETKTPGAASAQAFSKTLKVNDLPRAGDRTRSGDVHPGKHQSCWTIR